MISKIFYVFPIPAILDWGLEKFVSYKGNNATRFTSGFILGISYILLWTKFIKNPFDIEVWLIGFIYAIIVYFIIKYSSMRASYLG
ncbi:MAG: hypothetical protein OIN87_07385 [Candidatus Methanoperedens sp.]|nr:hypothetical protein [Candidatus Methanoperedens sp.]